MKILKINSSTENAYTAIQNSMSSIQNLVFCNNLDACACTGNSFC